MLSPRHCRRKPLCLFWVQMGTDHSEPIQKDQCKNLHIKTFFTLHFYLEVVFNTAGGGQLPPLPA